MCRKIVWCYIFILTLLDISTNTKLSAQGKSHGVTVHDSLIEGITFQDWRKESPDDGSGTVSLWPPSLQFGRAALATPHALTVTLTNIANTTMHLASVAGTTPDFHASFFEAKTLSPRANTTFTVVYLGRTEGPTNAHLYIHTSLGAHKYPVSAVGVASEWGVWPLVGVRAPLNATLDPLLTLYNPTDHTVQVSEVYSSGSWLGLQLPEGGAAAPARTWAVPPRASAPLVRLRIAPHLVRQYTHHNQQQHAPLTAYVRIKANITGGGLVVCVEARPAPPGEFTSPLQLRLRTRGSGDPADVLDISAGNSASVGVSLEASVWGARCSPAPYSPHAPPTDPPTHNGDAKTTANGNGVRGAGGVSVTLLRPQLQPHDELARTAQLTLDYSKMWTGYSESEDVMTESGSGAWCAGWVVLGRAALPYSVRLLPGTLRLNPPELHFVSGILDEEWRAVRDVRVHNEFGSAVHVERVEFGPEVEQYFQVESLAPLCVSRGGNEVVVRVRTRSDAGGGGGGGTTTLRTHLVLRTNVTDYTLPVLLYSGRLDIVWEWPNSTDGTLRLGTLCASSTRRVRARLHNNGVVTLCVNALHVTLPGAQLALDTTTQQSCAVPGGYVPAWLTVVAPARPCTQRGHVHVHAARHLQHKHTDEAPHTTANIELNVEYGRVQALPLTLDHAAPYVWSLSPLILESTMNITMKIVSLTLPTDNNAVSFKPPPGVPDSVELSTGKYTVGNIVYIPENICEPNCYTGLDIDTTDGMLWLRRASSPDLSSVNVDYVLHTKRYQQYIKQRSDNVTLYVHTDRVVQIPVSGTVSASWPKLSMSSGDAGLAGVGGSVTFTIRVRNPSQSHKLLLQPVIAGPVADVAEFPSCDACAVSPSSFRVVEWSTTQGAVNTWDASSDNNTTATSILLLDNDAQLDIKLMFIPQQPIAHYAYIHLRNNLTIVESILLSGHGVYPSFEIGGRRPGTNSPLLFEVSECDGDGVGVIRRTLSARNTGAVSVRMREWRVSGVACAARGFSVTPCNSVTLAPNETTTLTVTFASDWTLARVNAVLTLRTEHGRAKFALAATVPAPLLPKCAAATPPPPWHAPLRAAGTMLAITALAVVLAAAALDAERELRRARAARPPTAPRQPLDLRALAEQPQQVAPPVLVRRTVGRRRRAARVTPDPAAERRAFERWRRDVMNVRDDDSGRSSEDNEPPPTPSPSIPPVTCPRTHTPIDEATTEHTDEPVVTHDEYDADHETEERRDVSGDDDAASTGSGTASASSSTHTADVDEHDDNDECSHSPPRAAHAEPVGAAPTTPHAGVRVSSAPAEHTARHTRQRRDNNDTTRRTDRNIPHDNIEHNTRTRTNNNKHHTRKDKVCKRRDRPQSSPPRSPARAPEPRVTTALRWGESWSSVVAARGGGTGAHHPPPLAPIGSDVRRRQDPPPTDNSLFYFNGDPSHTAPRVDTEFTWRPPPPPPPLERPAFSPPRDFLDDRRSLSSVWGGALEPRPAAAAWLWGGLGADNAVRPPPGFGAPPRPVRPYDPFRSLASIWAPGARDWRANEPAPDEPRQ